MFYLFSTILTIVLMHPEYIIQTQANNDSSYVPKSKRGNLQIWMQSMTAWFRGEMDAIALKNENIQTYHENKRKTKAQESHYSNVAATPSRKEK
jgi:hypothetical protein